MAAHCLSITNPMSIQSAQNPNSSSRHSKALGVKSMLAENRENLQRLTNKQNTQQLRTTSAPVAPTGSWDRFPTARTVAQMMETMERLIDDPFSYSGQWPSPVPRAESVGFGRGRTPWEIKEGESEYKMRFDMPGMTKQDVRVWVEEKMLVLKAEKANKGENENEDKNREDDQWSAKSYGKYSCRIALPENVQFDKIKAEVKDGVLYITIPKVIGGGAKVLDIAVE